MYGSPPAIAEIAAYNNASSESEVHTNLGFVTALLG